MKIAFRYMIYIFTGVLIGGVIGYLIIGRHSNGNDFFLENLFNREKEASLGLDIGSKAPDFKLFSLDGELIQIGETRGKPVVINFWATWCAPCIIEMPLLQDRYDTYNSNLLILGVNAGESKSPIQKFIDNNDISFPILLDPSELVQKKYRIRAYPTTYFIDESGDIRAVHIGILTDTQLDEYLRIIGVFNG